MLKQGKTVVRRIDGRSRIPGHAFEARHLLELAVARYTSRPAPTCTEVGVRASRLYTMATRVVAVSRSDVWGADPETKARTGIHAHSVETLCAAGFLIIALEVLRKARAKFREDMFAARPHAQLRAVQAEFDGAVDLMDKALMLERARKEAKEAKRRRRASGRRPKRTAHSPRPPASVVLAAAALAARPPTRAPASPSPTSTTEGQDSPAVADHLRARSVTIGAAEPLDVAPERSSAGRPRGGSDGPSH